jgi:hypothetical protein
VSDDWSHSSQYPLEELTLDYFNVVDYDPHESVKVSVN